MSKYHCKRCGKKMTQGKFNPYNVTFNHSLFNIAVDGDVAYCRKCAEFHVKYENQFKGGTWIVDKHNTKTET